MMDVPPAWVALVRGRRELAAGVFRALRQHQASAGSEAEGESSGAMGYAGCSNLRYNAAVGCATPAGLDDCICSLGAGGESQARCDSPSVPDRAQAGTKLLAHDILSKPASASKQRALPEDNAVGGGEIRSLLVSAQDPPGSVDFSMPSP